jgi:hypothetical protein
MADIRTRRPPLVVLLQTEATVLMSLAIGQAGLASGFLTGSPGLLAVHRVNAVVMVVLTVLTCASAAVYWRSGGPRWPAAAAVTLLVVEVIQVALARSGVAGLHIFLGVLFVTAATVYTSYLFRSAHPPSAAPV